MPPSNKVIIFLISSRLYIIFGKHPFLRIILTTGRALDSCHYSSLEMVYETTYSMSDLSSCLIEFYNFLIYG
jgi:hypothetical protein